MAGHSKWANIQHRKGAQDAKRAKIFTRLIREITVAARNGGGETDKNPRLRLAVDRALGVNMPKDTIERAIKRGSGNLEGADYEFIRYEGYGPGGIAVMVDCLTDNRQRTVSEVRHAFSKNGGNLGTDGSVSFLFQHLGVLYVEGAEDKILELALEAGANDLITENDGSLVVLTHPDMYQNVKSALEIAKINITHAEVTMRPENTVALDEENASYLLKMLDMLEELDDVQHVYANAEISEAILEKLS
jgi:YebC/PmpR family DNA-binding regulatory protein